MNRTFFFPILGLGGLVSLTVLAAMGLLPAAAVVTFLGGLLMEGPSVGR